MKIITKEESGLPYEVAESYRILGQLPDGRICAINRLLYHWTMLVDLDWTGYRERYCYATFEGALQAMIEWNDQPEPEGWHRHPESGRRRDLRTGKEWVAP